VIPAEAATGLPLGAVPDLDGTHFRVWAPLARAVTVTSDRGDVPLEPEADGFFSGRSTAYRTGDLYQFMVDGNGPFPDPASRRQPWGVHGPSMIVDPTAFAWTDGEWRGVAPRDLVIYELHVGTFSPEGTFAGARKRLAHIQALGATAVELMPVADFPGDRNWGYDGTAIFAPARCYGSPDDLRHLVDEAHGMGLAVILDVVYNHLGPDGNYTGAFSPFYFNDRHKNPWGDGVNLDGPWSRAVRDFFLSNARHWIREYHMDGLRLDATHALQDDSPRHFLAELAAETRAAAPDRRVYVFAEDDRNLAVIVRPPEQGGWGLDGVWSDDFHHQVRRALTGDAAGYFGDYSGSEADVARTLRQGWFYTGQRSAFHKRLRGTDAAGVPLERFILSLQNHDQTGNRLLGERLHHGTASAAWRAALATLLFSPETPLLFMGQEWEAMTPFLYFTDHYSDLGRRVSEGRREEFKVFHGPGASGLDGIPDPQDVRTFLNSRLDWDELTRPNHARAFEFSKRLLALRRTAFAGEDAGFDASATPEGLLVLRRGAWALVARLSGRGGEESGLTGTWEPVLSTEDGAFCDDPSPPELTQKAAGVRAAFRRPGAVVLRARDGA
jgi:maltooligosyltrehalose trehalohydrolase